jgi:pimeloyl-ACP methyl ester carboxylesterase
VTLELLHHAPTALTPSRPPLLFIHGAWHGAWCWEVHFLPYFAAQGWDCYALSLRGHGESPGKDLLRWVSIQDYVDDVQSVVDQLPETPILIGHSMGGFIVQHLLEGRHFPAAVLVTPIPPSGTMGLLLRSIVHTPVAVIMSTFQFRLRPIIGNLALARRALFTQSLSDEVARQYYKKMGDESFLMLLDSTILNRPHVSRVRANSTPVYVLGAANDAIFTVREIQATGRAYGVTPVILDSIGHDVMLEADWERAAEPIQTWLADQFPPAMS